MDLNMNNLEPRDVMLLNALDRIGLNLSCLTTAVSRLEPKETDDGETLHSFVRLGLDGVGFDVRSINDEPAYCYGDATAEWRFTSPDELHALASAFRTKYAYLIDMVADEWARRAGDTIPAAEEA